MLYFQIFQLPERLYLFLNFHSLHGLVQFRDQLLILLDLLSQLLQLCLPRWNKKGPLSFMDENVRVHLEVLDQLLDEFDRWLFDPSGLQRLNISLGGTGDASQLFLGELLDGPDL
jgi:hypothetical protein